MNTLFACETEFWLNLKEHYLFPFYHPHTENKNEQYENYTPCSDEPQFWPSFELKD